MSAAEAHARCMESANKLAKWRNVFAGWLLGTRLKSDTESQYHRDLREAILLLRAEVSGLTRLVIELGITDERLFTVYAEEYEAYDKTLEERFPGFSTTYNGVKMKMPEAADTMEKMGFPQ